MPSRLQLENIVTQWVKVNDPNLHIHIRIDGEECTLKLLDENIALLVKPEKISNEHEAVSVIRNVLTAYKIRVAVIVGALYKR